MPAGGTFMIERLPKLVNQDPAIVRWARRMRETFMPRVQAFCARHGGH
jgi:hypothetical protein